MASKRYPRPACSKCGMPMMLRLDVQKWYCQTCREFSKPEEPPRPEPGTKDPARPRFLWLRLAAVVAFLLLIAILRIFFF